MEIKNREGGDGRGYCDAEFERFGRTEAFGRDWVLLGGSTGLTCSVGSEEGNRKIKAGAAGPTSSAASTRSVTYQAASIVELGQAELADLTKPMKLMGSVGSTNKILTGGAALTRTAMPELRRNKTGGRGGGKGEG